MQPKDCLLPFTPGLGRDVLSRSSCADVRRSSAGAAATSAHGSRRIVPRVEAVQQHSEAINRGEPGGARRFQEFKDR